MLAWFGETTLVATGLALVAAMAGRMRSIGPSARHILWLVVLLKMITPPLVSWPWAVPCRDLYRTTALSFADWRSWVGSSSDRDSLTSRSRYCESTFGQTTNGEGTPLQAVSNIGQPALREATPRGVDLHTPAGTWCNSTWQMAWPEATAVARGTTTVWLALSAILVVGQSVRIVRFRRRVHEALPASDDLAAEMARVAQCLGVRAPELLVVPGLGTPLLWCLGKPRLLLPGRLVETLPFDCWRGILAHELAHLRRGDHWVSRIELIAGIVWWWNPLYWLARSRLDAEAELACDAWVVWAFPKDRLTYAQVLFNIRVALSLARSAAPALGMVGSGRYFERRLTMILHHHIPCRLSPPSLLGAGLLALFALPSWLVASPATVTAQHSPTTTSITPVTSSGSTAPVADDDDKKIDLSKVEKEIEDRFGPGSEFEKEMEALGEKIGREMEAKFGPGSEFEKEMKALSKEMETRFGPGSEFEKKMKALGKEMEARFGPGSGFEKKTKERYGTDLGSKLQRKMLSKTPSTVTRPERGRLQEETKATAKARNLRRERRIAELEVQLRKLAEQLRALREGDADSE